MNISKFKLVYLLSVMLVPCLFTIKCSGSQHLSNVFVLETSDSEATPLSLVAHQNNKHDAQASTSTTPPNETLQKVRTVEESNTKIITDDQAISATTQSSQKRNKQPEQVGRKLEEKSELHNDHKQHSAALHTRNTNSNNQHPNHTTSRPKSPATTTSTSVHEHSEQGIPKTEERLLISISSSDHDDEHSYIKPQRTPQSSSHGLVQPSDDSSHNHAQHNPKLKPSITISIQDANINKQSVGGGGGASAVIVRPGDDGQSILIATVNSNSNKFIQKPHQSGHSSSSSSSSSSVNNPHTSSSSSSSSYPPYREPVNNPIQSIINQHVITSTTRRPTYSNDYNSGSSSTINRPTSGLSSTDERPSRPVTLVTEEPSLSGNTGGYNYDTVRPSQRPEYETSDLSSSSSSSSSSSGQQDGYQQGASKYELNERNCGIIQETKIVGGEEADPDDFMWMAAIVKSRPKDGQPRPFCGGSLITRRHVLTAAHCLENLAPRDVLVRLGSYDFDDMTASSLSADFAIDQFRVPAQYSKKNHVADIAIMRLKTPLSTSDNYKTVCMPQARRSYVGALGTVTGYGSQSQTFRRAAPKLRQVTVPIWENRKCSTVYKRNLTESFLCAGYEEGGKDACQGDSGGPLMTEGPEQRMMVVGVVSHGIGCGTPGYPGVYTRTTTFLDWIEKNTRE